MKTKAKNMNAPKWLQNNIALFSAVTVLIFGWLLTCGSMIAQSGDATDIWKTITTIHSASPYPSYVLYKGFSSLFPYVWLYDLAAVMGIDDFFFIRLYHAMLFSYVATIGIPAVTEHFLHYKPRLWQKLLLSASLFYFWSWTRALTQIMVDLPSCASFIAAMHLACKFDETTGDNRLVFVGVCGLMCALCGSISGQYMPAVMCIGIFVLIRVFRPNVKHPVVNLSRHKKFLTLACFVLGCAVVVGVRIVFKITIYERITADSSILDGGFWLRRGLLYMMDKQRMFMEPATLNDARGYALLQSLYGQNADSILDAAGQGGASFGIVEYFAVVIKHPIDFLIRYIDRFFLCLSPDRGRLSASSLFLGYLFVYLTLYTIVTRCQQARDIFCAEFWLAMAAPASVIATLALTVEMRYAMGLQSMIYGVALAGPALPEIYDKLCSFFTTLHKKGGCALLAQKRFAWGLIIGIIFIAVCFAHIGAIYAQTPLGEAMLFTW